MNPTHSKLIEALDHWNDTTLSDADLDALTAQLDSPEARARLVDHWLIERALPETLSQQTIRQQNPILQELPSDALSERVVRTHATLWRTLGAAAAGLAVGLFGASFVSAKVALSQSSRPKQQTLLLKEDFESNVAPQTQGLPKGIGFWSGDYSRIVPASLGIQPLSGRHMLQLQRADHEGKPPRPGYSADLYQYLVLPRPESSVDSSAHESIAAFEANFRVAPTPGATHYSGCLWIHALESLPAGEAPPEAWLRIEDLHVAPAADSPITASIRRNIQLQPGSKEWQKLRAEMPLPAGTRYLLVTLHVAEPRSNQTNPRHSPAEFPGLFIDDLQVSLLRNAPNP